MKILFPGLILFLTTAALIVIDAKTVFGGVTNTAGFAIGLVLLCLYGAGYLMYRIVSMYNEYRTNIDYQ